MLTSYGKWLFLALGAVVVFAMISQVAVQAANWAWQDKNSGQLRLLSAVGGLEPQTPIPAWRQGRTVIPQANEEAPVHIPNKTRDPPAIALPHRFEPIASPVSSPPRGRINTIAMTVTAYCPCKLCCGRLSNGVTASGKGVSANGGCFVAADASLPFGSRVSVPGYHQAMTVPVLDRGGKIKGHRLDVFFPSHFQAIQWGTRQLAVQVQSR